MPRQRPKAASGYTVLAQAEDEGRGHEFHDDSEDEDVFTDRAPLSATTTRYSAIQPQPRDRMRMPAQETPNGHAKRPSRKRMRSNSSGVDIKAINARLEKWAEEIASKFKITSIKGKSREAEQLEIHHTVFQAPDGVRPVTAESLAVDTLPEGGDRIGKLQFDDIVESVRVAIEMGVHPKMITQGSSGSYFARNTDGKVVGVFKPKDEEPYASRNPKWTKWLHRNLFPCFFGRACLIPNLSYVSEAAAYVLDSRLRTGLVPYTGIVYLSSKSFFYDFWERRRYWRGKGFPAKVGSFQVFLQGYKDANIFLQQHPWPDHSNTGFQPDDVPSKKKRPPWADCRPGSAQSDDEEYNPLPPQPPLQDESSGRPFHWSSALKQAFREELEKLVILDYIMRNTDRGLDNWMVKVDYHNEAVSIVSEPPKMNGGVASESTPAVRPVSVTADRPSSNDLMPYRKHASMLAESRSTTPSNSQDVNPPSISLGAIDNSLSWPWKHPDAWRSFPFGWLFLPVSLIGQPFSQKTRDHFLPLLTSTAWWSETQMALRKVFEQDSDFKESMFARQIAVMKGQAWNVVETLKQHDHGPLELTRRTRVCVWDDLVDIPVAIPLTRPSVEQARSHTSSVPQQEEIDIGASRASASISHPQQDLLGSPTGELPNPNRFELTRDEDTGDMSRVGEESTGPATVAVTDFAASEARQAKQSLSSVTLPSRPSPRSKTRFSFEFPRNTPPRRTRHSRSFSTRRGSNALLYEGDDLEGDLGYAAAEDMERNQKKVIVERLEAVKSKNPYFSWC